MSTYLWTGSNQDDDQSTSSLHDENPEYSNFKLEGVAGDDTLRAWIGGRRGSDQIYGGDGDDFLSGSAYKTDFASVTFHGGLGTDRVFFPGSTITSISRVGSSITEVKVVDKDDGSILTAQISDDVESFSYYSEPVGDTVYYLTEDIANNRNRTVDWDELYHRTYGKNADWASKGLDTYTEYHFPEPEPPPAIFLNTNSRTNPGTYTTTNSCSDTRTTTCSCSDTRRSTGSCADTRTRIS